MAKSVTMPADIKLDSDAVDATFHPQKDVLAIGDIDGDVTIHSYSTTQRNHLLMTLPHHKKACRVVRFSPGGDTLYTVSKDKSLQAVDMGQGAVSRAIQNAHNEPIYSLLVADENMVVTGDDDGNLKVWDMRTRKAVVDVNENSDFISDLALDDKRRYLLASCGDGTLTAFDIRKHKMKMQSELFDSELLSIAIIKGGGKVVVGSGEGTLEIFNWGEWGNMSDRFPGHPMSVDCIVPLSRDVVCTGSMDGVIRTVQILPNRFLPDIGRHGSLPVEALSLSRCKKYLTSCAHDEFVRFWNVDGATATSGKHTARKNDSSRAANTDDFFADMAPPDPTTSGTTVADADGDSSEDEDGTTDTELTSSDADNDTERD